MPPPRFPVAVIVRRTPLTNRWITERWDVIAVESDVQDGGVRSFRRIGENPDDDRWRFEGHAIELHRSEGEGYFLNITAPTPKIFVMWRTKEECSVLPIQPEVLTVSYNEAARLLDGGEQVEAVPMLPEVLAWMTPFVDAHYKPEPKRKVKRNDPFAEDSPRRAR